MCPRTVLDMPRVAAAAAVTAFRRCSAAAPSSSAARDLMWLLLVLAVVVQQAAVQVRAEPVPESWRLSRPQEQGQQGPLGYPQRGPWGGQGQRPAHAAGLPPGYPGQGGQGGLGPAQGAWPGRAPAPGPGFMAPNYPDYGELDGAGGVGGPCDFDEDCPEYAFCRLQQTCECKSPYKTSADGSSCLATIGTPCRSRYDCSGLGPGADCNQDVCHCGDGYVPSADGSCVKGVVRVLEACELNLQCESLGSGVACTDGKCQCVPGRHAYNDKCIANIALHAACSQTYECFIGEGYQSVVECREGTCRCKDQYTDTGDGKCSSTSGATRLSAVISSFIVVLLITSNI